MEKDKIARINELAHKKKTVGLTEEETLEQAELRKEYLQAIRANFKQTLDSIEYKDWVNKKKQCYLHYFFFCFYM